MTMTHSTATSSSLHIRGTQVHGVGQFDLSALGNSPQGILVTQLIGRNRFNVNFFLIPQICTKCKYFNYIE